LAGGFFGAAQRAIRRSLGFLHLSQLFKSGAAGRAAVFVDRHKSIIGDSQALATRLHMFYYHANLVPLWNRLEFIADRDPVGVEPAVALLEHS
jgi:hypothetical protein